MLDGSEFQAVVPATENAHSPNVIPGVALTGCNTTGPLRAAPW